MARPKARQEVQYRSLIFPEGMDVEGELQVKPVETNAKRVHRHRMEVRKFWVEVAPVHLLAILVGS